VVTMARHAVSARNVACRSIRPTTIGDISPHAQFLLRPRHAHKPLNVWVIRTSIPILAYACADLDLPHLRLLLASLAPPLVLLVLPHPLLHKKPTERKSEGESPAQKRMEIDR